ncbi:hypothetical protein GCM10009836_59240 [Pseudonocardia ailaonensis]|uniref:DUF3558 domain-containing protein n=1 Tax=Pseudonocardia ailaonensis TaxID=367279 RepID=A0ABN2NJK0_9PSEU
MRISPAAVLLIGALSAALVAGCGTSSSTRAAVASAAQGAPAGSSVQSAVQEAEQSASELAGRGTDPKPVDGCALLSAAEVEALIGTNDGPTPNGSGCTWQNNDNYFSVTIEVGNPGTATNGLPKWEPALGPERVVGKDMRDINGGIEFVAGTRDCIVQVASNRGTEDQQAGIALVPKLQSRIGS